MPPTMRENPPIPFVTKLKKLEAEGAVHYATDRPEVPKVVSVRRSF